MTMNTNYDIINEIGVGNITRNSCEIFNDYENNTATGYYSHAEGENTTAHGKGAHSEGSVTSTTQIAAHSEGVNSTSSGHGSHSENQGSSQGDYSHSEGYLTETTGANSHAEGKNALSEGQNSHTEGENSVAIGIASHAEGKKTETEGEKSHAEGYMSAARSSGAHAEGSNTTASGDDSHAEGKSTIASGIRSFAGGNGTVAGQPDQAAIGRFNQNGTDTLFEVGNGTSDTNRSNTFAVCKNGSISVGGVNLTPAQAQKLVGYKDGDFNHPYSVAMFPETLTICVGNTEQLTVLERPLGSDYERIIWTVDNPDVVSVSNTGNISEITAKKVGNAEVTATLVCKDTNKTEYTAKCLVTVENFVVVSKDGDSFNLEFSKGLKWEHVGFDVDEDVYAPEYAHDRAWSNLKKNFDKFQLAYIYLFDPLGVEFYFKNFGYKNEEDRLSVIDLLLLKDAVFERIYGVTPKYFRIIDGQRHNYIKQANLTKEERMNVYSDAEILFGDHAIIDEIYWSNVIFDLIKSVFENIPVISEVVLGVKMYQALFHAGSIKGVFSDGASTFVSEYIEHSNNATGKYLAAFSWANLIFENLLNALSLMRLENQGDLEIYQKVSNQDYVTYFKLNDGSKVSMTQIIYNNLIE